MKQSYKSLKALGIGLAHPKLISIQHYFFFVSSLLSPPSSFSLSQSFLSSLSPSSFSSSSSSISSSPSLSSLSAQYLDQRLKGCLWWGLAKGDGIGALILQSPAPFQILLYICAICCFTCQLHEPKTTNPFVARCTELWWLEFGSRSLLERPLTTRFPKCQLSGNHHCKFSHICMLQYNLFT